MIMKYIINYYILYYYCVEGNHIETEFSSNINLKLL